MQQGHIPDLAHGAVRESAWAPGPAVKLRFWGGIKHKANETIPLSAYRCPSCGYIEFYAPPA